MAKTSAPKPRWRAMAAASRSRGCMPPPSVSSPAVCARATVTDAKGTFVYKGKTVALTRAYLVKGPDAHKLLDRLAANVVPTEPGRTVYTGMLNERGGYESDVTVLRLAPTQFLIVTAFPVITIGLVVAAGLAGGAFSVLLATFLVERIGRRPFLAGLAASASPRSSAWCGGTAGR